MKFAADAMLGKLARWLRMSGYDVFYERAVEDNHILDVARSEERVLLTRDKALYGRAEKKGLKALLVTGQDFDTRLREVMDTWGITLKGDPAISRCPVCNGELREVGKEEVRKEAPKKVLEHINVFWRCTACGKVYWEGGHWAEIRKRVDHLWDK